MNFKKVLIVGALAVGALATAAFAFDPSTNPDEWQKMLQKSLSRLSTLPVILMDTVGQGSFNSYEGKLNAGPGNFSHSTLLYFVAGK